MWHSFDGKRAAFAFGVCLAAVGGAGPVADGPPRASAAPSVGVPIRFRLESPARVTLVIEDEGGTRVRNLVAETVFPAGDNTIYWDGYDDGERGAKGELTRRRVASGTYRVRGLTHQGIRMVYELTAYNPGSPP
jgi:hypothetical protein